MSPRKDNGPSLGTGAAAHRKPPTNQPEDSKEGTGWGKVPLKAATAPIRPTALKVFIAMSRHADGDTRLCWAGQEKIAAELGMFFNKKTGRPDATKVRLAQQELEKTGLIQPSGKHTYRNGSWTYQYLVAPFPDTADSAVSLGLSGDLRELTDAASFTTADAADFARTVAATFAAQSDLDSDPSKSNPRAAATTSSPVPGSSSPREPTKDRTPRPKEEQLAWLRAQMKTGDSSAI